MTPLNLESAVVPSLIKPWRDGFPSVQQPATWLLYSTTQPNDRTGGAFKTPTAITYVRYSFLSSLPSDDYPNDFSGFIRYINPTSSPYGGKPFNALNAGEQSAELVRLASDSYYFNLFADYRSSTYWYGTGFRAFGSAQVSATRKVLAQIESVANIKFVGVGENVPGGAVATGPEIRFGNTFQDQPFSGDYVENSGGVNNRYFRQASMSGGASDPGKLVNDVLIALGNRGTSANDQSEATDVPIGTYAYKSLIHEILHALGIDHPHDPGPNQLGSTNNRAFTLMSKEPYAGHVNPTDPLINNYGETPLVYDIGGLQFLYGAKAAPNGNVNGVPGVVPATGGSADTQYVLPNTYAERNRILTIWDTAGNDTIDASSQPATLEVTSTIRLGNNVMIDLRPGALSSINGDMNVAVAYESAQFGAPDRLIENAKGGFGNDTLIGNAVANELTGGLGNDTLKGEGAADTYIFSNVQSEGIDTIIDDGNGDRVKVGGVILGSGTTTSRVTGLWEDDYNNWFILKPNADQSTDLLVQHSSGLIVLKNWSNGKYGISLPSITSLADPNITTVAANIFGGDPFDVDPIANGTQIGYDTYGNVRVVVGSYATSSNADSLLGSPAADYILSGPGNDTITATQSPAVNPTGDTIDAGTGDDTVTAGAGSDKVIAGTGNDRVTGGAGNDWLQLDAGNDYADGGLDDDLMELGAGQDIGLGGSGKDRLFAGSKISMEDLSASPLSLNGTGTSPTKGDWLDGGPGDDTLVGGADADLILGDLGKDLLIGGGGDDNIYGDARTAILGDPDYKELTLGWVATRLAPVNGFYTVKVTSGGEIAGNSGLLGDADAVYAGAGNDMVAGGAGDDYIDAGDDNDLVFGERGADVIILGNGADIAYGDNGTQSVTIDNSDDFIDGGAGNDLLVGVWGNDVLIGGTGDDRLYGDNTNAPLYDGADYLDGGDGSDELYGNGGSDTLVGGKGNDTLNGGTGRDTYVFNKGDGEDIIDDPDDNTPNGTSLDKSIIILGEGINRSDVVFTRGSLLIGLGGADKIHLTLPANQTDPSLTKMVERLEFADGSVMTWQDILTQGFYFDGDRNNNSISGTNSNDRIRGFAAADILSELSGNDTLIGLAGNDTLEGGDGNDDLYGGTGDDLLKGGAGADLYWTEFQNGRDVIVDAAGSNTLRMIQDTSGLTLSHNANDLILTARGTTDSVTITNGYAAGGTAGWTLVAATTTVSLSTFVGAGALTTPADTTGLISQFDTRWRAYNNLPTASAPRDTRDANGNTVTVTTSTVLDGAGGDDTLTMSKDLPGVNYLRGVPGSLLIGGSGNDTLTGGADDDIFVGGTGNNLLDGGTGEDHYVIFAGTGSDTIVDRGGLAYINSGTPGPFDIAGVGGSDRVYLPSGVALANLTFTWSDELVKMERNTGAKFGVTNNKVPFGLRSMTAMLTLSWNSDTQSVKIAMPHSDDPLDFGIEEVRFADGTALTRAQLIAAAGPHDLNPNLAGTIINGDNADGEAGADTIAGNGILRGGEGNDSITGGTGRDAISGDEGADTLIGGAGADLLGFGLREFKGAGNTYRGGTGNDILLGTASSDVYEFNVGDGIDSIGDFWRDPGNSPRAQGLLPMLSASGQLVWDQNYTDATNYDPYLFDDYAHDYIGLDTLRLGTGISAANVVFMRAAGVNYGAGSADPSPVGVANATGADLVLTLGGSDQVRLFGWYNNPATISVYDILQDEFVSSTVGRALGRIEFADGTVWNKTYLDARSNNSIVGTSSANTLPGTANADWLSGLAGNDTLTGGDGDDALEGGSGADSMTGGAGNDTFLVDDAGDTVTEFTGGGTDTVLSSIARVLEGFVENLELIGGAALNGTGNTLPNIIIGNSAANFLDGGAGADTLIGGAGGDEYKIDNAGDSVIEYAADAGWDTIYTAVSRSVESNVEAMWAIDGSSATLTGNADANYLGGSSDSLGNRLIGGMGDDNYFVGPGDTVEELSGQGIDVVNSWGTWTLSDFVEKLWLGGTAAIDGIGNALGNEIKGNGNANLIDGKVGADTMVGAAGGDTYYVDNPGDVVTELAADVGWDTVYTSVNRSIESNVEAMWAIDGSSAILTGNADANFLGGSSDSLGNRLIGGLGDDNYFVGPGDTVEELSGQGIDVVNSWGTWTLSDSVEKLWLGGTAAIDGVGNALGNEIKGNGNTNLIDGKGGADTMVGAAGDDTYYVDNLGDVVTELATDVGWDTVYTSVNRSIESNVEAMWALDGSSATLTGNTDSNYLGGSSDSLGNRLIGGLGDDNYLVGPGDTVEELNGQGIDVVNSWGTWTLSNFVEKLWLGGTAAVDGVGNVLDNEIKGNSNANLIDGKEGVDTLIGGAGNDTYLLGRGYGSDTVQDVDSTAGNLDTARFLAGVASNQVWFRKASNNLDLEASILGTTDKFVVQNWYQDDAYHVEQFKTTDGNKTLSTTQIAFANLVQAMSGITPGSGATTLAEVTMSQNQRDALNVALNAVPSWQ